MRSPKGQSPGQGAGLKGALLGIGAAGFMRPPLSGEQGRNSNPHERQRARRPQRR